MIQLPEACDEASEAFKNGFSNICEIGKERIRRAGAKIKEENPIGTQDLDTGFRVLKGSMNTLELREIEKAKIKCAEEHFKKISPDGVVYKMIDSYKSLLDEVMK